LGEILHEIVRAEPVDPQREYQTLGVRWYGNGLFVKDKLMGHQIAASKLYCVEMGDFIYNRLFAWKGSFAVADAQCHECHVSNEFPCFRANEERLDARFLHYYFSQESSWSAALGLSTGATPTSRNRLKQAALLSLEVPIPSIEEQRRIVVRIDAVQQHLQQTDSLRASIDHDIASLLAVRFQETLRHAEWLPMQDVAPIVRRDVAVDPQTNYAELGIRSFGKGTFHKPTLSGIELGGKRVYRIEPGDLLFSNVFAWEGAIAVAKPEDASRVGSHRFISCVPHDGRVMAEFLRYYFLTEDGMGKIRDASPGGAGRNRTLGLAKLLAITVPVPPIQIQQQFVALQAELTRLRQTRLAEAALSEAVVPALIARTMAG
jgi:type I restriction enzyme S subunit